MTETLYTEAQTLPLLYPPPLNVEYFLAAHGYEAAPADLFTHPAICREDDPDHRRFYGDRPSYTNLEAVENAQGLDRFYVRLANQFETVKEILWSRAARYQWLCEFGYVADPVNLKDLDAWAKGRLPV